MIVRNGLTAPSLMLITDRSLCKAGVDLEEIVDEAVAGGVTAVQLREKDLPINELLSLARRLKRVTSGRALLLVNGSLDIALAADADGIHLPEGVLSVAEARRVGGDKFIIGRSVHSVAASVRAEKEGSDYLQLGSIFPSNSHPGVEPLGLSAVRGVRSKVCIPVLAVGGVDQRNIGKTIAAGATGVAVISAILPSSSPQIIARKLISIMEGAIA